VLVGILKNILERARGIFINLFFEIKKIIFKVFGGIWLLKKGTFLVVTQWLVISESLGAPYVYSEG